MVEIRGMYSMLWQGLTVSILILLFCTGMLGCNAQGHPGSAADPPPHHGPKGFRNIHPHPRNSFLDFLWWWLGGGPVEKASIPLQDVPAFVPDLEKPDLNKINHPHPQKIQVTWIGHSTFLIQVEGFNILTDPMFSERASPVSFAGPKRLVPPGISISDLPFIHAVIISHNHYDHLDAPTVKRLGNLTRYFVPIGLSRWFKKRNIVNLVEMDWWASSQLDTIRFHAVPIQHFSSRTQCDRNKTLWAGWVIETGAGNIFFSGDTGYALLFKEIGKKLGPIHLSFIPIGGYSPRWLMRPMHVNPPEAVMIHRDLASAQSVGMHWGTFKLTDEPMAEPPLYLKKALKEAGISEIAFIVMKVGETRVFE
jgi:L-ascorbate metabolism protein UlaG (beta-lactamase superfamily)